MGSGEKQVIGTGVGQLVHELLHVEGIDRLLEWQWGAVPGNGLGRPVDADAVPAFCQPVGVGPLVRAGLLRFAAKEVSGHNTRCPGCGQGDEIAVVP